MLSARPAVPPTLVGFLLLASAALAPLIEAPSIPGAASTIERAPRDAVHPDPDARGPAAAPPVAFEENVGQTDPSVRMIARTRDATVFFAPAEVVMVLHAPSPASARASVVVPGEPPAPSAAAVVRTTFRGASPDPRIVGSEPLHATTSYLLGSDPSAWRAAVATFARVTYVDLYPGIDLLYFASSEGGIEYDFAVAPGADPAAIRLAFEGVNGVEVDGRGDLVLSTPAGEIRHRSPVAYQDGPASAENVPARFVVDASGVVSFALGPYDTSRPILIDPPITFATYLGGTGGDEAISVTADPAGNVYVVGGTASIDFPTRSPAQPRSAGAYDAFVVKYDRSGALVYSTYLGGSEFDRAWAVAVDATGAVYVVGATGSRNFPVRDAVQPTSGGQFDAFLAKLSPDGRSIAYATYLGGRNGEQGTGVAVDADGSASIMGFSYSDNFPVKDAFQPKFAGAIDVFVSKLVPDGKAFVFSTYLGGRGDDEGLALGSDPVGNLYLTGDTTSIDFPTKTPLQVRYAGGYDAFVVKIDATTKAVAYATYLGGSGFDQGQGITADASGNAYVVGVTESKNFPTRGAFQAATGGDSDGFVSKIDASGLLLAYSTYLGGASYDNARGIGVDATGHAYVAGYTFSSNFPTKDPLQAAYAGDGDMFVTKVGATGATLRFSTYYGNVNRDVGLGIAVGPRGSWGFVGYTFSGNLLTKNAVQPRFAGEYDAFVLAFDECADAPCPEPRTCAAPLVATPVARVGLAYELTLPGTGVEARECASVETSAGGSTVLTESATASADAGGRCDVQGALHLFAADEATSYPFGRRC